MFTIRNNISYINTMAQQNPAELVAAAETRYNDIITGIANRARSSPGHKLVMLAGPSASGKTTTAQKLAETLQHHSAMAYRLSLDDFYLERENLPRLPDDTADIESVHALDLSLLRDTLTTLMEHGRAAVPHYSFRLGKRSRWDELCLGDDDMLVVEGLHALNPEITQACPACTKIYVNVSTRIVDDSGVVLSKTQLRLARRILRDSQFRNSTAAETLAMWPAVLAGERQYLAPCKRYADVLVNSVHVYEPCVFAARVLPMLADLICEESRALAAGLARFTHLPEIQVPADSLLREFLGN
ncbi:MAG: nucleoside kinase [Oscillospiraceae bacterium]|nr:nucleoside kinase [Oscillospiraceae bacterium]